jgi:hypothetical protein
MVPLMRSVLRMLGVRRPEVLFVGLCALRERQRLPKKDAPARARLGGKLRCRCSPPGGKEHL